MHSQKYPKHIDPGLESHLPTHLGKTLLCLGRINPFCHTVQSVALGLKISYVQTHTTDTHSFSKDSPSVLAPNQRAGDNEVEVS